MRPLLKAAIAWAAAGWLGAFAGPADTLYRFAGGLEASGAHAEAALEFRRMLFFSDTREDSIRARSGLMRSLDAAGLTQQASAQSAPLLAMMREKGGRERVQWESLRILFRLSDLVPAREKAYAILREEPSPELRNRTLKILTALEITEGQPEEALRRAAQLAESCPVSIPRWKDSLAGILTRPPPKSPLLAAVFSGAVPGLGQAYAGVYGGAFNSLLLNGLTGYGLVQGFDQGRWADMLLYLTLFERFYVAGIKLAKARAEDVNLEDSKRRRLLALEMVASACPDGALP